jgi:uncharacterized protein (TIGR00725 family)
VIVSVFGSSATRPGDLEYQDAVRLGLLLAQSGLTVANGGYSGVMEAVSAGARQGGGHVIGITAPTVFPNRSGANPHVSEERPEPTITERIHRLVAVSDATITLPGNIGTLTEFVMAWNVNFLAPLSGAPQRLQVAVGPKWPRLVAFLAEEFGADPSLVTCVDTVEEASRLVAAHLRNPGKPGSSR